MAKPELGMKRTCLACAAKFYDLNRNPIACPKCGTPFLMEARAVRPEVQDDEEAEGLGTAAGAEFVPLEAADGDPEKAAVEDVDLDDEAIEDDDDTFLEQEEDEDDGDVSDLIDGDLEEDEDN